MVPQQCFTKNGLPRMNRLLRMTHQQWSTKHYIFLHVISDILFIHRSIDASHLISSYIPCLYHISSFSIVQQWHLISSHLISYPMSLPCLCILNCLSINRIAFFIVSIFFLSIASSPSLARLHLQQQHYRLKRHMPNSHLYTHFSILYPRAHYISPFSTVNPQHSSSSASSPLSFHPTIALSLSSSTNNSLTSRPQVGQSTNQSISNSHFATFASHVHVPTIYHQVAMSTVFFTYCSTVYQAASPVKRLLYLHKQLLCSPELI